jgi:hypothetical protein
MKYAVQMGSDAIIYILYFVRTGLDVRKLIGGYKDTDTLL